MFRCRAQQPDHFQPSHGRVRIIVFLDQLHNGQRFPTIGQEHFLLCLTAFTNRERCWFASRNLSA